MRAVRVHELVGPSGLRLDDNVPEPTVSAGHVLIDVEAAGVNFPDLLMTQGKYQFKPTLPFSPGGEVAGIVRSVGSGVTSLVVGDRVAATMLSGAYAEVVAVPELACVKVPAQISFEIAAATLLTYATTLHALADRASLVRDETLLVLGAAGGVGIAAVELGVVLGARVIAAASTDDKIAFCKEHGATEGINYATEDLKTRLKAFGGADVIFDPVGGPLSETALRGINWEGRYLVVGFASGDIPKLPLNLLLLKGCQAVGVFWGQFAMREPQKNHAHAEQLFAWIAEGKLRPAVDAVLPFSQAQDALERISARTVKGKLVLVP